MQDRHPRPRGRIRRHPWPQSFWALIALLALLDPAPAVAEQPSWAKVQCPEVSYLIEDGDLDGAGIQAQQGRLDCMVLVAEAYRERGDLATAKGLLQDVIGFAEDPQRATYPLLLFYKVAYLNGTKADYSNLDRRDPGLAGEAKAVLLDQRRQDIIDYLSDPGDKACPNLEAPFDDALLTKVADICTAMAAWQQSAEAGPNRLADQQAQLNDLGASYPVNAYGQRIPAPGWIDQERKRVELSLACVAGYDDQIAAYNAVRTDGSALEQQLLSLRGARDAIAPCRPWLAKIGIDEVRLLATLNRVEQQSQDRQEQMTALKRLEDEIATAVGSDRIPSLQQFWNWEKRSQAMAYGSLPKGYSDTLQALRTFYQCERNYRSIRVGTRLPDACQQLGFTADTQPRAGMLSVYADERAARRVIGSFLAPPGARQAAVGSESCDLYKTFTYLAEKSNAFKRKPELSFEPTVRKTLEACGASPNCISSDSWSALQPHKGWVYTAFADCRLQQGRYQDAVENLDIAAGQLAPNADAQLQALIVRRLRAVGQLARGAGESAFDQAGLQTMVGKKKGSAWLPDMLASAPPATRPIQPSMDNDATRQAASSTPADQSASRTPIATASSNGQSGDDWYANNWSEIAKLPYFQTLGADVSDDLGGLFASIEQANPDILSLLRCWDQKELASQIRLGSRAVNRVVDRLRLAQPGMLHQIGLEVAASQDVFELRNEIGYLPADFALRHAIARRAIELGCVGIATQAIQSITAEHLAAVGPEASTLNRVLVVYLARQPQSSANACTAP